MKFVFKELKRHKWRTIFSIAGYTIATLFLIIVLSIHNTQKENSFGILKSTGTHFIAYIPTDENCCISNKAEVAVVAEGVNSMMMDEGLLRTIKNVEGVKDAAPCLLFKMYHQNFKSDVSLAGIDTNNLATKSNACAKTNLISGKFLSNNPHELVAEQSFASAWNLEVGDTLEIFGGKMVLAGIVNTGIKPVKADFYTPIEFVREILKDKLLCSATGFDMNIVLVEVSDSRLQDRVIEKINNMMYKFNVSSYNCYEPAYKVMSIIDKASTGLTILIILFLVIFSAKTQTTALIERFREIGILKSLGWSDIDLGTNILLVSLVQSFIGVSLGIIFGFGIVQIINGLEISVPQYLNSNFQIVNITLIYLLSFSGAIIACIFPILKIINNKPGDIIKNFI